MQIKGPVVSHPTLTRRIPCDTPVNHSFCTSFALTMRQAIKCWLDCWPDFWIAECAALSLSSGSILGICWLLYHFDGTPNRKWHDVPLNAAVSTLTTLARGMILMVMASCLGQYKWIWFKQQLRPLTDFELINEASRGPAGSMRLLGETAWNFSLGRSKWRNQGYALLQHQQWTY